MGSAIFVLVALGQVAFFVAGMLVTRAHHRRQRAQQHRRDLDNVVAALAALPADGEEASTIAELEFAALKYGRTWRAMTRRIRELMRDGNWAGAVTPTKEELAEAEAEVLLAARAHANHLDGVQPYAPPARGEVARG